MSKKDYEVLKPISFGGRIEKGDTVRMTEAEAENHGSDYLVEVGKKVSTEEVEEEEKALEDMTQKELSAKAKELELKSTGTKPELLERIQLHEESSDEEEVSDEDEESSDEE